MADQRQGYWSERLMSDPEFAALWRQAQALISAAMRTDGRDFQQAVMSLAPQTRAELLRLQQALNRRAMDLGWTPQGHDDRIRNVDGAPAPSRGTWLDRNEDWVGPAAVGGLAGFGLLAPLFGAGAGAGTGAAGAAGSGGASAAGTAAGTAAASMPAWLSKVIQGGAAASIPLLARSFGGGGGSSGATADRYDSIIAGLVPSLTKIANINAARHEAGGPLFDQVLKMASARMPNWSK